MTLCEKATGLMPVELWMKKLHLTKKDVTRILRHPETIEGWQADRISVLLGIYRFEFEALTGTKIIKGNEYRRPE